MTDLKGIVINMVTLGILILALMSFVIINQSNSDLDEEDRITNNTLIDSSFSSLQTKLNEQQKSQDSLDSLQNAPPQTDEYVGDLNVFSIIKTTTTISSFVTGLWNIFIALPMSILGVSPIVAGAISSLLLLLLGVGTWAIWKGAIS